MKKKQHPHPLKYFNDQYMKRANELKKAQLGLNINGMDIEKTSYTPQDERREMKQRRQLDRMEHKLKKRALRQQISEQNAHIAYNRSKKRQYRAKNQPFFLNQIL